MTKLGFVPLVSLIAVAATAGCDMSDARATATLEATAGLHHIQLHWTGGAAAGYMVYRSHDGVAFDRLTSAPITSGSYDDPIGSPAGDGVRYQYRIARDDADEPSNTVSEIHGTRMAASYPDGFTADPAASPYVVDGTTTLGGDLWLAPGTKLFMLAGSAIDFAGAGRRLLIDGLFQATGTAAAPVRLTAHAVSGHLADDEGFQIVFQGEPYQPEDGSGSRIDHAEISNLGDPTGSDRRSPLSVIGSGIALDHVKLSANSQGLVPGMALTSGGWIILRHCWLESLPISITSDLRATPFAVTDSVFRGGNSFRVARVESPAIRAGQIDRNDFDATTLAELDQVTGTATIPLGDNYWAAFDGGSTIPRIRNDSSTASVDFADPSEPLTDPPTGAGPDWGGFATGFERPIRERTP